MINSNFCSFLILTAIIFIIWYCNNKSINSSFETIKGKYNKHTVCELDEDDDESILNWHICRKKEFRTEEEMNNKESVLHYYEVFPHKLRMWYLEAHLELGVKLVYPDDFNYNYAIFPQGHISKINDLLSENSKEYNFCFIGGFRTDRATRKNRAWVQIFVNKMFDENSYLQFTDNRTLGAYKKKGNFDHTLTKEGFVPKYIKFEERNRFDLNYFDTMTKCKYCLAPAGDSMYSMRFYEALISKCIPVVKKIDETFRSKAESLLGYKFYFSSESKWTYDLKWVAHNYELFVNYHTLTKSATNFTSQ